MPIPRAEAGWKQNTGDHKPGGDTRNYMSHLNRSAVKSLSIVRSVNFSNIV